MQSKTHSSFGRVSARLALVAALGTILAPGIASAAGADQAESCPAVTTAEVDAQFARFNDAWATKNPDTVTALFSAEPVLLATVSNTPRTTPAMVRDYFVSFLRNSPVGRIETSTTRIDCHTASRVGTWTVTLTDPDTQQSRDVHARYSFIYKHENGEWKIDHLHSSMMPEAGH